ncbi:tetratricopeptide repeat protein [Marinitoga sp. 38H-ov]|uniref:tetratricopeptide repeat protein n=1 Tax=Marinitoga sp. 38H-ov TaxID=1755814 RepID=UPI0013EA46EC|nr:tetratricopeptide repeat protein [Marinitoga sp. 38H-ov]KAF2955677.1 hypothetical protein AS160_00770 [Marinitoga sp. 38H-ov]
MSDNEKKEINLEDLDVDKINELMDLDSLENEKIEEVNEKVVPLDNIEDTQEPDINEVEKLAEELEKKYSEDQKSEITSTETEEIPELEIEESTETEEIPELEIEESTETEEIPELEIEESTGTEEIPELEIEESTETEEIPELEIEESAEVEEKPELEEKPEQENIQNSDITKNEILENKGEGSMSKWENDLVQTKVENELIVPEYEKKENDDRIKLVETRLFNKLEEYENKINELMEKNKKLEEKIENYYSKIEKSEQAIAILLKNIVSVTLGDTKDIFNSILNIKSLISEKNKVYLINIAEKFKDKISEEYKFVFNYILGNLYSEIKEISKAEKYYLRALQDCEKDKSLDMQFNLSIIQNNLGAIYADSKKYDKAKKYFASSLEIRNKLVEKNEKYNIYLFNSLNNLGMLEIKLGNLDSAERYLNEAYEILNKFEISTEDKALLFINLGDLYSEKAIAEKAKEYYEKSLKEYLKLYNNDQYNYREKVNEIMSMLHKYDPNIYEKYRL